MKLIAVLAAVSILIVQSQAVSQTNSACDASCEGVSGVSCLYCPSCGTCSSVGVIDRCFGAGTAHISIDDGPNEFTSEQLDILKELGVKASFWLIGTNINGDLSYPALVRRIVSEGHLVGSHTNNHVSLNMGSSSGQAGAHVIPEMRDSVNIISNTIGYGYSVQYLRPPNGELNSVVRKTVQNFGLTPVMWNVDSLDLVVGASQSTILANVKKALVSYSRDAHSLIILMHAKARFSLDTMRTVVDWVKRAGYKFVDAPTCFNATAISRPPRTDEPVQCVHAPQSLAFSGCTQNIGCSNPDAGTCCSRFGSCGSGPAFCAVGCQNGPCDVCTSGGYVPSAALFNDAPAGGSTGGVATTTPPPPTPSSSGPSAAGSTGGGDGGLTADDGSHNSNQTLHAGAASVRGFPLTIVALLLAIMAVGVTAAVL